MDCCDECRWVNAGGRRGPLTDQEFADWVLFQHGPATADRLTEMYKAIAGREGWHRSGSSGYTLHAMRKQSGTIAIVIGDDDGWRWQVWHDGDHTPARPIQGPPAQTAAEAVRLADDLRVRP